METIFFPIKIVLLGDSNTGKSSLIYSWVHNRFNMNIQSTIGCAFTSIDVDLNLNHKIQYQIWDTAGQEKYRALTEVYYRKANIIIITFAWNNLKSFLNVQYWYNNIQEKMISTDYIIIIIATKNDLVKKISEQQVNDFINKYNLQLISTSSVNQSGIEKFKNIINDNVKLKWSTQINNFDNNLIINNVQALNVEYEKKKCC